MPSPRSMRRATVFFFCAALLTGAAAQSDETLTSTSPLLPTQQCEVLASTSLGDYFPDVVPTISHAPPTVCCAKCAALKACHSWTVVDFSNGADPQCHLKSANKAQAEARKLTGNPSLSVVACDLEVEFGRLLVITDKHEPGDKGWACPSGCDKTADKRFTSGFLGGAPSPAPPPPTPPPPPPPPPTPVPPPAPAPGIKCNPNAKPPEMCPNKQPCPKSGACPEPGPAPPTPAPSGPSPPPGNFTTYTLTGAKCINGAPATVEAWVNPTPSTTWLIQIGSASPSVGFCISAGACAQFGAKNGTALCNQMFTLFHQNSLISLLLKRGTHD